MSQKTKQEDQPELAALKSVLDAGFAYADSKTKALLNEVNAAVSKAIETVESQKQVLEIKINDMPSVKLSESAHPQLAELITLSKIANATNAKHPYLVGPAGSGKTSMVPQLAEALGLRYGMISFTAGASETWLWGRQTPTGFQRGQFAEFYENGGVFLFDELDAADANVLIALNSALANGHAYNPIEGKQVTRHKEFFVVAAGNTFGLGADFAYTGRQRLDRSTRDRFVPIIVDYLPNIEAKICPDDDLRELFVAIRNELREQRDENAADISYRSLVHAYSCFTQNIPIDRILQLQFGGWPEGLLEQTLEAVNS